MSIFTDPNTGKTYQMNPLTGGYTEVAGINTDATTKLPFRDQLRQRISQGQQTLETGAQALTPYLATAGRYGPGVAFGVNQMLQPGGLIPGIAATTASVSATALATPFVRGLTAAMPGPLGKLARVAVPAAAGVGAGMLGNFGGSLLTKGAAPDVKTEIPRVINTPLGPVALNEAGAQEAFIDRQRQREIDAYNTVSSMDLAKAKDLYKFQADIDYQNTQRNFPLVNQMKNADMVRQQALLASQGNQLSRQALLGMAGSLAVGGQAQAGETLRTMMTSNPYANVVLR